MALKNYTTEVEAEKSAAEMLRRLTRFGAREITQEFDREGELAGLRFAIDTKHGRQQFRLPARWQAVQTLLRQQYNDAVPGVERRHTTERWARRVGWRILRDWLDAQLALVEVNMVSLEETMLPYLLVPDTDQTLYEAFVERGVPRPAVEGAAKVIALPARSSGR